MRLLLGRDQQGMARVEELATVAAVGFNPFRRQVNRRSDVVIVVIALVAIATMVFWAALPR